MIIKKTKNIEKKRVCCSNCGKLLFIRYDDVETPIVHDEAILQFKLIEIRCTSCKTDNRIWMA